MCKPYAAEQADIGSFAQRPQSDIPPDLKIGDDMFFLVIRGGEGRGVIRVEGGVVFLLVAFAIAQASHIGPGAVSRPETNLAADAPAVVRLQLLRESAKSINTIE